MKEKLPKKEGKEICSIYSSAPTRIGLFGGGTDVEPFASRYGGLCLSVAINLRQRMEMKFDDGNYECICEIEHANPNFYEPFYESFDIRPSRIKATSDTIIESGLGSSAAAAVALTGALSLAKGESLTRNEVAERAWEIEVNKLRLYGGRQDQYISANGGICLMKFNGGNVQIEKMPQDFGKLIIDNIVMFYTGENRRSAGIQEGLRELNSDQVLALKAIKSLTIDAIDFMDKDSPELFGRLLDYYWEYKKASNEGVTNERIDSIYTVAKDHGAYGGKIMGAGGGGHMFFVCDPARKEELIENITFLNCKHVNFSVDMKGVEIEKK